MDLIYRFEKILKRKKVKGKKMALVKWLGNEGVNLNRNHDPVAKDFLDRAYVKELKDETDTLYFKSDY